MASSASRAHTLTPIATLVFGSALLLLTACMPDHDGDAIASHETSGSHDHDHGHEIEIAAHELGDIDFRAGCEPEAAAGIDDGLGYLHHMMYEQARTAFHRVSERHPDCAMGHWGVAMTLFQPLWPTRPSAEDIRQGWDALQRAEAAEVRSARDQALIEATAAFYSDPDDAGWWTRIRRWAEGMAAAFDAHADDADTAALFALSRLTLAYVDEEDRAALHEQAAAVLRDVHAVMPGHPGAMHYLIHADDVDGRADRNLDIVEAYSGIAPEVPHALHMPSHLYVRLGRWPETIAWNARSAAAALNFPVGDTISFHYLHAIDYKVYGYLQRGEDDKAAAIAATALAKGAHQPSFNSAFHLAAIPARLAVERRDWEAARALAARTPDNQSWDAALWPEGMTWFARGLGAVHAGDLDAARTADQRLQELRDAARAEGEEGFARYIEVDRLILAGWRAQASDDPGTAREHLRAAMELDRTVEKHPITPGALYPPGEAKGDLLLELGRPGEALAAYRASEKRWPGRFHTVAGAAKAANAAGKEEVAQRYYADLLELTGDSERSALDTARQVVAAH